MKKIPHVIPYQGSKRKLANEILAYMNFDIQTFYEPFVGSGAITLAAATDGMAKKFVVSDKLEPLAELWKMIIDNPELLVKEYSNLWYGQLSNPNEFYNQTRFEYNASKSPSALLYLIARCVKNSIRFNNKGDFNQGPDNRRLGLKPEKLNIEAHSMSRLMKNKINIFANDYRTVIAAATENDLIYMDPPYQGTSGRRDSRYAYLLNIEELIDSMNDMNKKNIPFMLSFDGTCGDKSYGFGLPSSLNLTKINLKAGRSSQATLLGRDDVTIESLYLSPALINKTNRRTNQSQPSLL